MFTCLVKLRLNPPFKDLAYRFNLHFASVCKSFHKCIDILYANLQQLIIWPDAELLLEKLPAVFKPYFHYARCIIDCFEVLIERPLSFQARAATYSNYKKHNTVKVFIAVAPTGSISLISKAWGGRVSDTVISQKCGFLDMIEEGDLLIVDLILQMSYLSEAKLEIPAFTKGKKQLSAREVEKSRQIAHVRNASLDK